MASKIVRNTDYYSNPVDDETAPSNPVLAGECHFTLANNGDVTADIDINMTDLGAMTIVAGGYTINGATSFGASAYIEGLAWPGGCGKPLYDGRCFPDSLLLLAT